MPSFQNPEAFFLLLLIPLLYLLRKLKILTRITFPAVLEDWGGKAFEWNGSAQKLLSKISKVMIVLGFLLVVIALADPVLSRQEKVYTSLGTDMIFVLDASPSMAARDMDTLTRMDAAKNTIRRVLENDDGSRIGIVVLGSEACVFVPPTPDYNIVNEKLNEIKIGLLGDGSAIGDGLSTAVCHLMSSSAPNKCIILLTDGENNAGAIHPETAANLAATNKIPVYVVGIGSKGSVVLEYEDPVSGKWYSGHYDSNYNSASLKKLASISGGHYFEVRTTDSFLTTIMNVTKKESVVQNFTYKTVNDLLYDKFLLVGIILLSLAWLIKRVFLNEML
ncbi:MAG: VWA domain-containing protein [Treponema sp.]|nr:VWA domain-containing protein [Treponema sp.]